MESEDGSVNISPLARKKGYCCIFNGRRHLHGVIPPAKYNKRYPWFGATLLCKNKRKFYDAMCALYELVKTMKMLGLIANWRAVLKAEEEVRNVCPNCWFEGHVVVSLRRAQQLQFLELCEDELCLRCLENTSNTDEESDDEESDDEECN